MLPVVFARGFEGSTGFIAGGMGFEGSCGFLKCDCRTFCVTIGALGVGGKGLVLGGGGFELCGKKVGGGGCDGRTWSGLGLG